MKILDSGGIPVSEGVSGGSEYSLYWSHGEKAQLRILTKGNYDFSKYDKMTMWMYSVKKQVHRSGSFARKTAAVTICIR